MALANTLLIVLFGVLAILGIVSTSVLLLAYFYLRELLTTPLMAKIKGETIGVITRGLHQTFIRIPKGATNVDTGLKDNKDESLYWTINKESLVLLPNGVPATYMNDGFFSTYKPDNYLKLADELASSHIENIRNFGIKIKDDDGTERVIYPIDPKAPAFKMPKILTARNLAEKIKIEANKMKDSLMETDKKPFYAVLTIGAIVVLGAIALVVIKLGLDYNSCPCLKNMAMTTTTTLYNMATSTTIPIQPPPMI